MLPRVKHHTCGPTTAGKMDTPKNIQEGSAKIICKDIDILSHPINKYFKSGTDFYV